MNISPMAIAISTDFQKNDSSIVSDLKYGKTLNAKANTAPHNRTEMKFH